MISLIATTLILTPHKEPCTGKEIHPQTYRWGFQLQVNRLVQLVFSATWKKQGRPISLPTHKGKHEMQKHQQTVVTRPCSHRWIKPNLRPRMPSAPWNATSNKNRHATDFNTQALPRQWKEILGIRLVGRFHPKNSRWPTRKAGFFSKTKSWKCEVRDTFEKWKTHYVVRKEHLQKVCMCPLNHLNRTAHLFSDLEKTKN